MEFELEVGPFAADEAGHEEPEDRVRHWRIEDRGAAEWAMRRYAEAASRRSAIEDQAREWHDRVELWAKAEDAEPARREAYFAERLVEWAKRERRATGQATMRLPSGSIATRAAQPRVEVVDPEALAAWIEESLGEEAAKSMVRRVVTVPTAVARKLGHAKDDQWVSEHGEAIPGVKVTLADPEFPYTATITAELGR